MKKFWVVLLSLGLVMAFSISAFAVSADFTGQYYLRQNYINNPSLADQNQGTQRAAAAFTDQRLRLFMRLKVVEGVTLTTRTDILESVWGREQSMMPFGSMTLTPSTAAAPQAGNTAKQMRDFNIGNASFEQLYLNFNTPIGTFIVGNKSGTPYQWGTWFLNNSGTAAGIYWTKTFGSITVIADLAKTSKGDMYSNGTGVLVQPGLNAMDKDRDYYDLAVQYKDKGMEGGVMLSYFRWANQRSGSAYPGVTGATSNLQTAWVLDPYFKGKFGPVDVEGEGYYMNGKVDYSDARMIAAGAAMKDQDIEAMGIYLQGKVNMGPAWVGLSGVYASGADTFVAGDGSKIKGSQLSNFGYATDNYSGIWSNYLPNILYGYASDSYHTYLNVAGPSGAAITQTSDNMQLVNLIGGMAVGKSLNFDGKLSYVKADKVAAGWDNKIGTELDLRGIYKIYDCLSYGVGFAYLWTGDYFKGAGIGARDSLSNNYYLTHWLDLRF